MSKIELERYTPAEAEEITEVSQATVRNWRRSKYLPTHAGHARYDIAELLRMVAMRMQVARGIVPEVASRWAQKISMALYQKMISSTKAYAPDIFEAARNEFASGVSAETSRLEAMGIDVSQDDVVWARIIEKVTDETELALGKTPDWFVIWANGEGEFFYEGDDFEGEFFSNVSFDSAHMRGPVTLFSLGAIAHMVADRLPRPILRLAREGAKQ